MKTKRVQTQYVEDSTEKRAPKGETTIAAQVGAMEIFTKQI